MDSHNATMDAFAMYQQQQMEFMRLATSNTLYKVAEDINKFYIPVLVPVGIVGNILSFLVMTQPHNRSMSISLYISMLAISDTSVLLVALVSYLDTVHLVPWPPDQHWFCGIYTSFMTVGAMCSTYFILSMTFDRFYSIIRPHKAASFNTVKRAKITIVCIVILSILLNISFLFTITNMGRHCVSTFTLFAEIYHWFIYTLNYVIPFCSLLTMNSVIIHTLRTRPTIVNTKSSERSHGQGQGQSQGQNTRHIFAILLLVTFSYLILVSPMYMMNIYTNFIDYTKTPESFAGFHLLYNVSHKLYFTNNGVNFFLYVTSGQKFRTDLVKLFKCFSLKSKSKDSVSKSSEIETKISTIEA